MIQSQDDLIDAATEVSNTLSLLLGSIAGISLLVGGIGVDEHHARLRHGADA